MKQSNLHVVDWSTIPEPTDDGAADHLVGLYLPDLSLQATGGGSVNLSRLTDWSVLFFYPMTGQPDVPLPNGWDEIPGARGCTPQSCAFRDMSKDLAARGVQTIYGISTQDTDYQTEAVHRLELPFPLLSDDSGALATALNLPTIEVEGRVLIKRITLILNGTKIEKVFYPVFPPDKNPQDVIEYMTALDLET